MARYWQQQYEDMNKTIKSMTDENARLEKELAKAQRNVLDFQNEIDELKFVIEKREGTIRELQTDLNNKDNLIAGYEMTKAGECDGIPI